MKYVVHKDHEPYDVYIGRGSLWGNPYSHDPTSKAPYIVGSREEAINCYAEYLLSNDKLLRQIPQLKGKVLGCFCDPLPCHGHVLAALANNLDYEHIIGSI